MKHLRLFEHFDKGDIEYLAYKYFDEIALGEIKFHNGSARVENNEWDVTHTIMFVPMRFSSDVDLNAIPATLIEFNISDDDKSDNIYRFCEKLKNEYGILTGIYDETDDIAPGEIVESVIVSIMCVKSEDMKKIATDYHT